MNKKKFLIAAMILGLSFFAAIYFVKPIGVSTQFNVLAGIIQNQFDKNLIVEDPDAEHGYVSTNAYYNKDGGKLAAAIENPINYDFIFVLAIPLGAFLGYLVRKKTKPEDAFTPSDSCKLPDKKTTLRNYLFSFIGGFILLYGARMANGCTSGHMMSGMMQGSVSGYVFAACAFATAIPTAIIVKKIVKKGRA